MSEQKSITITVTGYDATRVEEYLDEQIGRQVSAGLELKVTDAVEARTRTLVDELTRDRVKKEIDALLDEGWKQTDQWGAETGKTFTMRERVRGVLDAKRDNYDRSTLVEKWLKEAVDYKLGTILNEELKSARERMKAAFDEVLQAKFTTSIRDALGLKS